MSTLQKNPQQGETMATETNNTLHNLKQQELQLLVASQMKNQENALLDIKHKELNELLKRHILRQSELEDVIKQQQERINNHIQILMTAQSSVPYLESYSLGSVAKSKNNDDGEAKPLEKIELEAEIKKLEMEKLRLEDLLSNISDNHEKEIVMIEKSYKKRINILEENIKSIGERYEEELKSLELFYQKKIESFNVDKESLVNAFENKIKILEENHKTFIEKMKINYETDIETLKRHYEEMIDNIRKSKLMEFAIKEESGSYMDVLRRAFNNLENASGDIQSLHETLQEKIFGMEKEREIQLNVRERKIEGMHNFFFAYKTNF
jgi:Fas-binding factor 1